MTWFGSWYVLRDCLQWLKISLWRIIWHHSSGRYFHKPWSGRFYNHEFPDNQIAQITFTTIDVICTGDRSRYSWWRHQMKTFSAILAIRAGNSPVPGEFPAPRPVTRSFAVFFDLRLNKWLRRYRAHYDVIVMKAWHCVSKRVQVLLSSDIHYIRVFSEKNHI